MTTTAFDTMRQAIETRLAAAFPSDKIEFPNVPFTPPNALYLSLFINMGLTQQVGLGKTKRFRHNGVIDVSIHAPKNKSGIESGKKSDLVVGAFRNAYFSGVQCLTPTVRPLGIQVERYRVAVSIPFYFDEINEN